MGAACTRPAADGDADNRLPTSSRAGAGPRLDWQDPRLNSPPLPPKRRPSSDDAGRAFLEEEVKRLQNENVLARARLAKADIEKDDKEEQNRLLAFQLGLLLDMYTLQMLDQERILKEKQQAAAAGGG